LQTQDVVRQGRQDGEQRPPARRLRRLDSSRLLFGWREVGATPTTGAPLGDVNVVSKPVIPLSARGLQRSAETVLPKRAAQVPIFRSAVAPMNGR
jgi:hypothetical protein